MSRCLVPTTVYVLRRIDAKFLIALLVLCATAPAYAQCPPGDVTASTGGISWGALTTTVTTTDGLQVRHRTNETSGSGIATSIAQAWVPAGTPSACDAHVDVSLPSVPGRTPRSFSWGESSAFASVTIPRAGLMRAKVLTSDSELLNGTHNGQTGPQVTFLVDGVSVPVDLLQLDQDGYLSHSIEMRVGPGLHTLEVRARNVSRPPQDFFSAGGDLDASGTFRIFVDQPSSVKDVNRFGNPGSGLAGAGVRLLSNGGTVAATTAGAGGTFEFTGMDASQLFDLQLDQGNLVRTYQDVTLSSLPAISLTVPVSLRAALDTELAKLETTPPLVLAYDTAAARRLTQDWNVAQPEASQVHVDRDLAMARMLIASEGLAGLFVETAPVATDTAKLTVDTITTMLSLRKVMSEIAEQAGRRASELAGNAIGAAVTRRLNLVLEFIVTALELATDKLQAAVVDAVKSVLPSWAADLFEQSLKLIVTTMLEAFSSGSWSSSDARSGFVEGIVTELAAQIGGRVLASGYVLQTKEDLTIAGIRARRLDSNVDIVSAFGTVQTRVSDVAISHQELIALNAAIGDTAKGWSTVADLSLLVGRRPGGQLIATIGGVVKAVSAGALTGLSVANYLALYSTAFDQAPAVVREAFDPPLASKSSAMPWATWRAAKTLPNTYAGRLAALRTALETATDETAVERGEELLAADAELNAAIALEHLRLLAVTDDETPEMLREALAALSAVEGLLAGERIVLYGHLIGAFEPEFADPTVTMAQILTQIDAVGMALAQLDAALANAQTAAQGLEAPASLFVAEHGLEHLTARMEIPPGPFTLRAEVINAGGETANDASVMLDLGTEENSPKLVLLDPPLQALGTLAPGERRVLRWRGEYLDSASSPVQTNLVANYSISPQLAVGQVEPVIGGFALVAGKDRVFIGGFEP